MPKNFDYANTLYAIKNGEKPGNQPQKQVPVEKVEKKPPSVPVDAIPASQVETIQKPTAPDMPFGGGLVEEEKKVPPAKELEFGGSGSGSQSEPVDPPPEDNPARAEPPKLHPKAEVKVLSPHGDSGMDGYFDKEDEPEELVPEEGDVEPGDPEEYMPEQENDPEVLARIEREQIEAEVRARVDAEYADKTGKKIAGKTGGRPKGPVVQRKGVRKEDVDMSRLRNIPKCLVDVARDAFPDATRQEDAVAAYIYFREGMPSHLVVPDEIVELAKNYSGENVTIGTVRDIVERDVLDLKIQNRDLARKLDIIEMAAAYMIFEATGFRKGELSSPETVDFLEHGMADLMKRLETQSELKRQRDRQKEGRPIR